MPRRIISLDGMLHDYGSKMAREYTVQLYSEYGFWALIFSLL